MIHIVCNLCGRDDWHVRFPVTMTDPDSLNVDAYRCTSSSYGSHAQIVQCNHCGYVYANPRWPSEALIQAYTAVEDEVYEREREGRELTFQKHLQAMEKIRGENKRGRILDVGAYIGVFVEVARQRGWEAWGLEPSAWAAQAAHQRGLNIIEGTLESPTLQGQTFDVITLWDVIEHVDDPYSELARAFQLLTPGGMVVVHTMDIDSWMARLMGARWPWLMDMHIHYFSQKTLAQMLEKIGYRVIWSGAQGRYLRLGYVASRVEGLSPFLGKLFRRVVYGLRLDRLAIPLNFGDLFTVYAIRPEKGSG
ncbi:MAG: class I SAM-dependent methyltransferase [Chloroflexi bacterium]|nr:class I SAM-dependent methyltransferase [Chloroflexota bacterium]MBP8055219.1 class I SAM-dependent methyltransferase [Chloroflexota bacterium]